MPEAARSAGCAALGSCANGLRRSHCSMARATPGSPVIVTAPVSTSLCTVDTPIQMAVIERSELRTKRSTSNPGSVRHRSTSPWLTTSHQLRLGAGGSG